MIVFSPSVARRFLLMAPCWMLWSAPASQAQTAPGRMQQVTHRATVVLKERETTLAKAAQGQILDGAISPDGKRIALIVAGEGGERVLVDGVAGRRYDQIALRGLLWSPDSRRLAYIAIRGEELVLVIGDKESAPFDTIAKESAAWSRDSRHFAVGGVRAGRGVVDLDGQAQNAFAFEGVANEPVSFSPDGRHLAFAAGRGEKWTVVVDGKVGHEFDAIDRNQSSDTSLIWSRDNRHLAYVATRGKETFVVADGAQSQPFDHFLTGSDLRFAGPNQLEIVGVRDGKLMHLSWTLVPRPVAPPTPPRNRPVPLRGQVLARLQQP